MLRELCVAIGLAALGCATTSTTSTTWTELTPYQGRPGHVQSVREVVQRVQGDPVGGALAGALIGGILFHGHGPSTLFGAAAGAAVGAAASSGAAERRTYEVRVRFDNGEEGVFIYDAYSPFRPGDRVVLTPEGIEPY